MPPSSRPRRLLAGAVLAAVAGLAAACSGSASPSAGAAASTSSSAAGSPSATASPSDAARPSPSAKPTAPWDAAPADPTIRVQPGSHPGVLPGDVLIADKLNNRLVIVDPKGRVRWSFPGPGDLAPGQSFLIPDDAFFTPDGKQIIATEEDDQVISVIDVATRRIVYRYGHPGQWGSAPDYVHNPDDAMMLPNGGILTADIKNCRILFIPAHAHTPSRIFGSAGYGCLHQPPTRWGSPNGAFPMRDGHYLVTEINGAWVDELSLAGQVSWSLQLPDVRYPSDSNEISPGHYLTVDYSRPGQVLEFDRSGRVTWRYRPYGADELNHPSLGLPLPNGDVLVNDDYNHRVIVIDPRTNRIVWQYGHTGVAGSAPGYLDNPDGVDLVPPYSLLVTHAASMGH